MTVQGLIESALRVLGVIAAGESASTDDIADGIEALNLLIEEWDLEGLMAPLYTSVSFNTSAAKAAYTFGPAGGDVTTNAPINRVHSIKLTVSSLDYLIKNRLSQDQYDAIADKTTTGIPAGFLDSQGATLTTVSLFPVPTGTYAAALRCADGNVADYAAGSETLSMPGYYKAALKWNLALQLSPEYGVEPGQVVVSQAVNAKARLLSFVAANRVEPTAVQVSSLTGDGTGYDIATDGYP